MSWSWSHTNEAYGAAYDNLHAMPVETLREVYAEWLAWDGDTFAPQIDVDKFDRELTLVQCDDAETLANVIWDKMSSEETGRTCDNGGFNAWTCPFGCGCHTVSFDDEGNATE